MVIYMVIYTVICMAIYTYIYIYIYIKLSRENDCGRHSGTFVVLLGALKTTKIALGALRSHPKSLKNA